MKNDNNYSFVPGIAMLGLQVKYLWSNADSAVNRSFGSYCRSLSMRSTASGSYRSNILRRVRGYFVLKDAMLSLNEGRSANVVAFSISGVPQVENMQST